MSNAAHPQLVARSQIVDAIARAPGASYLLAILGVALTIWTPGFFTYANLTNVVLQVAVLTIVALGMTLVILTEGIDLSLGAVLGLCGVAAALLVTAGYSAAARGRRGARHRHGVRRAQRDAVRRGRNAALRRHARHLRHRAKHCDGADQGRFGHEPAGLFPLVQRRRLRRNPGADLDDDRGLRRSPGFSSTAPSSAATFSRSAATGARSSSRERA